MGILADEIVIVYSVNTPETIYAIYALNRLGAIVNMVDPRTGAAGIHAYICESKARFAVTIEPAYSLMVKAAIDTSLQTIISISPSDSLSQLKRILYRRKNKPVVLEKDAITWQEFLSLGKNERIRDIPYCKERCCVIAHTGGTTGTPKGVMLSNENFNAVTHGYRYLGIPFKRQHRCFNDLSPFIMYGLCLGIPTTLCYGLEDFVSHL